MNKLLRWRYVSLLGFIGFFGMLPYVWMLSRFGDPRVADGGLNDGEFFWFEDVIFQGGAACLIISWARAVYETFRLDLKAWFFLVFICFPITPLYFWMTDKDKTDEPLGSIAEDTFPP